MKTPEDIKKGLKYCGAMYEWDGSCTGCPYERNDGECDGSMETDALAYIQQLESTTCQVSKALCGKENATLEELLQAVDQLKVDRMAWEDVAASPGAVEDMARENYRLTERLAQVERERDAAVGDLTKAMSLDGVEDCSFCKNIKKPYCHPCKFEWRGVCEENTKEE